MRSSAFTLIEVLVVIAIIAMLLAISVPPSHRARDQARAVACRANIKSLLTSFHTYNDDNGTLPHSFWAMRRPPPPGDYPGTSVTDLPGWYWFNFTQTPTNILKCPAKNLQDPWLQQNILCGNYGVNRSLCRSSFDMRKYRDAFGGQPLSIANVPESSRTLLLVDSGYALTCWWQARDDPLIKPDGGTLEYTAYIPGMEINEERILERGQLDDAIWGRHPNQTVNVGYADGHVERSAADALLVEKTGEGQYKNRTPLWESP